MRRRDFVALAAAATTVPAARAQNYPARPIRLLVPFEAGGTIDVVGRVVAAQIHKQTGHTIFIDNKPGANSAIGTFEAARAPADGYTLVNVSPSFVLNPLLKSKSPYGLDDFVPITALGVGTGYLLVVRRDMPVNTVAELKAYAAKSPKELFYGTPGVGNALHLATEYFANRIGIKVQHIPYKGSASALNAILASQVDLMVVSPATVISPAAAGQLKVIAFSGDQRSKEFPNVPTMIESGVDGFVMKGTWVGWFAPKGTPPAIVNQLHAEVAKALKDPGVAKQLTDGGFEPDGRSPAEFAKFVRSEFVRYGEVAKSAKIEID